jgi:hypothetical protein
VIPADSFRSVVVYFAINLVSTSCVDRYNPSFLNPCISLGTVDANAARRDANDHGEVTTEART